MSSTMTKKNVGDRERIASGALAALAIGGAVRRLVSGRGAGNFALVAIEGLSGGALAFRSATGYCPAKEGLAARIAAVRAKPQPVRSSIVVNLTPAQVSEALGSPTLEDGRKIYRGSRAGLDWELETTAYEAKKRTLLVACFRRGGSIPLLSKAVEHVLATELRNIKALLETGEIATIAGQSEGGRSLIGGTIARVTTSARHALDGFAKQQIKELHA